MERTASEIPHPLLRKGKLKKLVDAIRRGNKPEAVKKALFYDKSNAIADATKDLSIATDVFEPLEEVGKRSGPMAKTCHKKRWTKRDSKGKYQKRCWSSSASNHFGMQGKKMCQ